MSDDPVPRHIGNYVIREKIGSGGFSSVYLAIDLRTQIPVAIKVIEKNKVVAEKFEREIQLLKMLDFPFCVAFYEFLDNDTFYFIVMEYVQGNTLYKFISTRGRSPEWLCRHIFCQLISTLE